MKISFINVGYGEAILIEIDKPGKQFTMLVDGGNPGDEYYSNFPKRIKAADFLREQGISRLDLLVLTHCHEDHVGGLLEVVKHFEVEEIWSNYVLPDSYLGKRIPVLPDYQQSTINFVNALNIFNELSALLASKGKNIKKISGIELNKEIVEDFNIDILGPPKELSDDLSAALADIYTSSDADVVRDTLISLDKVINNTSIVMRLKCSGKSILLPADVYNTYWDYFLNNSIDLQADILKIPHHGQINGVSEEFIKAVQPGFVVFCASHDRLYNSSNPEVIKLITKCNAETYFFFTDAVDLPPYSTPQQKHKAVVFDLTGDNAVTVRYA